MCPTDKEQNQKRKKTVKRAFLLIILGSVVVLTTVLLSSFNSSEIKPDKVEWLQEMKERMEAKKTLNEPYL
jgi:hypothetical protein